MPLGPVPTKDGRTEVEATGHLPRRELRHQVKKTPMKNCHLLPAAVLVCPCRNQWPGRQGLLLGYQGKCPVQESHCDVL